MNKLLLLAGVTGLLAACGAASGGTAEGPSPAEKAAALEKQAEVQDAVGDKAGAAKLREEAAALRTQAQPAG